jgi:hypothetical protein
VCTYVFLRHLDDAHALGAEDPLLERLVRLVVAPLRVPVVLDVALARLVGSPDLHPVALAVVVRARNPAITINARVWLAVEQRAELVDLGEALPGHGRVGLVGGGSG